MVSRIAERIEHQYRVGHRGKYGAQSVVAVEALSDKAARSFGGEPASGCWKIWLEDTQDAVDGAEDARPGPGLMRALGPIAHLIGGSDEQLVDAHPFWIASAGFQGVEDR